MSNITAMCRTYSQNQRPVGTNDSLWCGQILTSRVEEFSTMIGQYWDQFDEQFVRNVFKYFMNQTQLKRSYWPDQAGWYPQRIHMISLIARFLGTSWGPSGADRNKVGPMLAPMNFAIWDVWRKRNDHVSGDKVFHSFSIYQLHSIGMFEFSWKYGNRN